MSGGIFQVFRWAPFKLRQTVAYIQNLFSAGEQGAWYDPSDMSTLFQDSAGTTPVTAVEQPVGRILDKSGRGNHATQATTTKRPVLSRRVNLLAKTEQFMDAPWTTVNTSVTPNAAIAPDGSLTAAKIVATSYSGQHIFQQLFTAPAGEVALTVVAKAAEAPIMCIRLFDAGAAAGFATYFNVLSGTVGTNAAGNTATITPAGNGYYTCTVRRVALGGGSSVFQLMPCLTDGTFNYSGDGASGIFVWRSSLTLATDAHLPYQWVNTATDYDADPAKFPAYLRFDGVDDALQTGNINFTGTDKMTVWAGATALDMGRTSGAANQLLSSNGDNYNGFGLRTPHTPGSITFYSSGSTSYAEPQEADLGAAPRSMVICGVGDQSAPLSQLRRDGVLRASSTAVQGASGGYGNRPMWLGSITGTIRFFNGRLYSLIVRGAQTPLSQIQTVESYIKQKMRLP